MRLTLVAHVANFEPSMGDLIKLFELINNGADEEEKVPLSDWEYYSEQIQNLYELDEVTSNTLAKQMADIVSIPGLKDKIRLM